MIWRDCRLAMVGATACLLLQSSQTWAQEKPIGILLAAGDIATCSTDETRSGKATADLISAEIAKAEASDPKIEVRVLALGDLAYDHGSPKNFECFDATWGRFKDRILPVPGNHDYETGNGGAYFKYFASTLEQVKADKKLAYYSVEFPQQAPPEYRRWQLIGLNSNKDTGASTAQVKWLVAELERTKDKRCVLAFSHAYFYSSGFHGHKDSSDKASALVPGKEMQAIFKALHASRASLFVAGHDHHYEQLGRASAQAKPADLGASAVVADGVRSFIVGTGGKSLYSKYYQKKWTFSEAYDAKSYGILKIELYPDSYTWQFIPTRPNTASMVIVKDIKTDSCNRS